jgi:hypothetical protein
MNLTQPETPITLADAAQHFGFTVLTLRAEADRGRLTIYKIGRRYYTTPADVMQMVQLCRVERKAQGSISTRSAGNGLSATARTSAALDALKQTLATQKSSSRATSPANTRPSRPQRLSSRMS